MTFETLWFRLAGLALGNSVWSVALVLAGFMAGLALGNAWMAAWGHRLQRPARWYAAIEIAIGLTGLSLILLLPATQEAFAGLFRSLAGHPTWMNAARFVIAFVVLLAPTTAMGMTLPLLVRLLLPDEPRYAVALGQCYGWNTLGAVLGAAAAEMIWIRWLGLVGAGCAAAAANAAAGWLALRLSDSRVSSSEAVLPRAAEPGTFNHNPDRARGERVTLEPASAPWRLGRGLMAACLAGGLMLALEVVWFRFLTLFFNATTQVFATLLAVVLASIALGGMFTARWFRASAQGESEPLVSAPGLDGMADEKDESLSPRAPSWSAFAAPRFLRPLALLAGALVVFTYGLFTQVHTLLRGSGTAEMIVLWAATLFLLAPVSVLSGMLFPLLGHVVEQEVRSETRATGLLTLANTVGAMLGSLVAAFLFLPRLGLERSFFVLALGYAGVALLAPSRPQAAPPRRALFTVAAAYALSLIFFPFGKMDRVCFNAFARTRPDVRRVAVHEGLTETAIYFQHRWLGQPFYYRLVTGHYSMSATDPRSQRYMKFYVYLPVALHPELRKALLICYGLGSTAKALVETETLQQIDVVDISENILRGAAVVYGHGAANPLEDARVRVHVEDGRFFLRTRTEQYDLITAEPPPPKMAGVVNLYSEQFFRLARKRLAPGGFLTYWLPVYQLTTEETRSILKAFLNAFPDATLWAGGGLNWMLVGTRDAHEPVAATHFVRAWEEAVTRRPRLLLGFERPEQLGAAFLGDADYLKKLTRASRPLTDYFPRRLSASLAEREPEAPLYRQVMDVDQARRRFAQSRWVARLWPKALRHTTLRWFRYQRMIDYALYPLYRPSESRVFADLDGVLVQTALYTLPFWLLQTSPQEAALAEALPSEKQSAPRANYCLAAQAVATRAYQEAVRRLEERPPSPVAPEDRPRFRLYLYALCQAGQTDKARSAAEWWQDVTRHDPGAQGWLRWLDTRFGLHLEAAGR